MVARWIAACLIDCALVVILSLAVFAPLLFIESSLIVVLVLLLLFMLSFCAVYIAYAAAFDGFRGRTLGKAL